MTQKGVIVVFAFMFYGYAADENVFEVYQYGQRHHHEQSNTQNSTAIYTEDRSQSQSLSQSQPQDLITDKNQYSLRDSGVDQKQYQPQDQSFFLKPMFPEDSSLYQKQNEPEVSSRYEKKNQHQDPDVDQIQSNLVEQNQDKTQRQQHPQYPGLDEREQHPQDQSLFNDIYNTYHRQQYTKDQSPNQGQLSKSQDFTLSQRPSYSYDQSLNHNQHKIQGLKVSQTESQQNHNLYTKQYQYLHDHSNSLDNNVDKIQREDIKSSESPEKSKGVINWLLEMGKRSLQLQMSRRTGGVRRQDGLNFDSIPGLAFMGATVGPQEAFEELLIKLLETIAFVICDILFSVYWPVPNKR